MRYMLLPIAAGLMACSVDVEETSATDDAVAECVADLEPSFPDAPPSLKSDPTTDLGCVPEREEERACGYATTISAEQPDSSFADVCATFVDCECLRAYEACGGEVHRECNPRCWPELGLEYDHDAC